MAIQKLEPLQGLDHSWLNKINELVDAVNELQKQESDTDDIAEVKKENIYTKTMRMDKEFVEIECQRLQTELDRTKKQLKIAVDALGYYASENSWDETNRWMFVENGFEFARDTLEQITALEQKEVK